MASIKALFWDNDGILVDTEHLYFHATQQALASAGIPFTREQYVQFFLVQGSGAFHLAAAHGLSPADIGELRHLRDLAFSALLEQRTHVIAGVHEVLTAIRGRFTMGIVTSSERQHFDLIHRDSGLLHHFEFVLAQGDYERSKPHPDPYLKALDRAGVCANECLVIEDSLRGLSAARDAGLRCVVVPGDFTRDCDFSGAHAVLENLAQLLPLLD